MPGSVIVKSILHVPTEEACEDRLYDDKLQVKHAPAANKKLKQDSNFNKI